MKRAAFGVFAAACCAAAGCGHGGGGYPGMGGGGGFAFPVSAAPLTRGTIVQTFSVTGQVNAKLAATMSSVISGTVEAVNVQIGQHVSKGDLLVQIDDSTLRAQLQQNEALLEASRAKLAQTQANDTGTAASSNAGLASAEVGARTAQMNLQRDESLFRQGYVSQSALDDARQAAAAADAGLRAAQVSAQNAQLTVGGQSAAVADVRNAQATVDQDAAAVAVTQSQIAQSEVRAPFDGVVTWRAVDPGALAAPGTSLVQVSQLDTVYVDAGISGDSLPFVHVGTPVTVSVSSIPNRTWKGTVTYLNLSAEPGTLTYIARITIPNPDLVLHGGMVASVAVEQQRKSGVLMAPRAAVYQTDSGYAMFTVGPCPPMPGGAGGGGAPAGGGAAGGGKPGGGPPPKMQCAASVAVDTGLENDASIEVSGQGLKPGMLTILNHPATLQPGTPVQPIPAQAQPAH